ncbi:hypothetical protein [Paraburkholderia eburnea]|uniref:hypothetical protein n=1 Tax=Paraburkholderia eburnea TaxID=1189126 RepID=UPI0011AFF327|nr:hypothetical protein [Paraburkholderia eburnea]
MEKSILFSGINDCIAELIDMKQPRQGSQSPGKLDRCTAKTPKNSKKSRLRKFANDRPVFSPG